jgi:hypothetical protein
VTTVAGQQDFLDEIVHERSKQNPEFLDLFEARGTVTVAPRPAPASEQLRLA